MCRRWLAFGGAARCPGGNGLRHPLSGIGLVDQGKAPPEYLAGILIHPTVLDKTQ
jgi:hypothetical protein